MLIVGIIFAVVWLGFALFFSAKDQKPPRKYNGCCPDCGHARCTYHPMCRDCAEATASARPPLDPPPKEPRLYRE